MLSARVAKFAFALAFVLSAAAFLMPQTGPPREGIPGFDKLAHFAVFAVLGALARIAWPNPRLVILFGALAVYGLAIELTQSVVPGRGPEALDWVADAFGAALGLVLAKRLAYPT